MTVDFPRESAEYAPMVAAPLMDRCVCGAPPIIGSKVDRSCGEACPVDLNATLVIARERPQWAAPRFGQLVMRARGTGRDAAPDHDPQWTPDYIPIRAATWSVQFTDSCSIPRSCSRRASTAFKRRPQQLHSMM